MKKKSIIIIILVIALATFILIKRNTSNNNNNNTQDKTIYENLKRRNEGNQRHPAHSLKRYIPHESIKYKSTNELDYDELKHDYITDKYTSFSIGKEINLTDFSYKNLIKEIDKE